MKRKEFHEKFDKCETEEEKNRILEEFWDSNTWVRFISISFSIIIILIIFWIVLWLFIRLVRFIAL